jgi:tellurite resistance protein TerC
MSYSVKNNHSVTWSIFQIFHTPNSHKHKPLLWGICGAIIFRMVFFVVGEVMMHAFWWVHFVLGFFLMYTGYKILGMDDDDEDVPNQNPVFLWLIARIKLIDSYSPEPKFFERVALDASNQEPVLPDWSPAMLPQDYDAEAAGGDPSKGRDLVFRTYATRLVLVVICLELTDIVFAVDSVSAIIAQIPDLYLAYTACVFAMLGLRATFFAVDELVKLFTLLPYAVSVILIFIGAKLVLKGWIHVPAEVVCVILVSVLALSIIASLVWDKFGPKEEEEEEEAGENTKPGMEVNAFKAKGLEADDTDAVPAKA